VFAGPTMYYLRRTSPYLLPGISRCMGKPFWAGRSTAHTSNVSYPLVRFNYMFSERLPEKIIAKVS
jgi:hypothetical protein